MNCRAECECLLRGDEDRFAGGDEGANFVTEGDVVDWRAGNGQDVFFLF